MDERQARAATLLEAFETARPPSPSWGDDDRAWADRVAREASGPATGVDAFVAARAGHALQRLGERERWVRRVDLGKGRWRLVGAVVVAVAFVLGVAAHAIGSEQRINLLAPPFWGVLLWNVAVYAALAAGWFRRTYLRRDAEPGPIARAVQWLAGVRRAGAAARATRTVPRVRAAAVDALAAAGTTAAVRAGAAAGADDDTDLLGVAASAGPPRRAFAARWWRRSAPLSYLRAEALLHAGAAAVALGLVAGLYARGLVLDFRVVWESTLFDAPAAHAVVAAVFQPASTLTGIALPDAAAFAALRTTPSAPIAGAPAAPWLHLVATTLAIAVIGPRALLALACAAGAAWRRRRFPLPLEQAYFQRLARLVGGVAAQAVVVPYATTPSPQATLALREVIADAFGADASMRVAPAVAFGAEDEATPTLAAGTTHALALFDLAATPEAENHGRFLAALRESMPAGAELLALVDASAFERRFGALAERVAERRETWRRFAESCGVEVRVVRLDDAPAGRAASAVAAHAAPSRP